MEKNIASKTNLAPKTEHNSINNDSDIENDVKEDGDCDIKSE